MTADGDTQHMAIAIIDDSVTSLAILKHMSAMSKISDILSFSDPEVAIERLSRQDVNMVIVDYEMPKMNGIQFITALRNSRCNRNTPIIMVTSASAREIRIKALKAGATDFLNKPLDPAEFRTRISNLLKLKPLSTSATG